MADVVNLRTVRKRARRQKDDLLAQSNRIAHGQSEASRRLAARQKDKTAHDHEQHRMEKGDGR